jgi:hypothetical protein
VFGELLAAAGKTVPVIRLPAVEGASWKIVENCGLSMPAALQMTDDQLAEKLNTDEFTAAAVGSQLAVWWQQSARALDQVLRFPGAGTATAD